MKHETRNVKQPKYFKTKTKIIAVKSSTIGYCQDIFFRQYLHLPFKIKKLKTGIKSCQIKLCLQCGQ